MRIYFPLRDRGNSGFRARLAAIVLACTLYTPPILQAQSNNAYGTANCSASFLSSCPGQETLFNADSPAVAAPFPVIGAAFWEVSVMLLGLAGVWASRRHRLGVTEEGDVS